ncbi:hypothetical protein B0H17DRAFT_1100799 [Mycena rosella]|uniref:Uncharacterized protein n=1 Tax=Mycena rosella TaxID=1033263 RepID=A0AAD7CN64_MYCRO|nr:hypothetical protein B0H17DRAFT_1100799 [Mycena rosella]
MSSGLKLEGRNGGVGQLLAAPEECCRGITGAMLFLKLNARTLSYVDRFDILERADREYRRGRVHTCSRMLVPHDGWVLHHRDEAT